MPPLNGCSLCGEDFASLRAFDKHFVGKPSDRRRGCLTPEQMRAGAYRPNARGRWELKAHADGARWRFRDTA